MLFKHDKRIGIFMPLILRWEEYNIIMNIYFHSLIVIHK